jgi:hypothetical protein
MEEMRAAGVQPEVTWNTLLKACVQRSDVAGAGMEEMQMAGVQANEAPCTTPLKALVNWSDLQRKFLALNEELGCFPVSGYLEMRYVESRRRLVAIPISVVAQGCRSFRFQSPFL